MKNEAVIDRSSSSSGGTPKVLRALRHRNYRLFFAGQFVSLTGTWMQFVAQAWLIYRLTGSAAQLELVGFAGQIPVFALALVGGIAADKLNRRCILVATQIALMILALALAVVTLTGQVRVWQVFALASLLGVVNAFALMYSRCCWINCVGA